VYEVRQPEDRGGRDVLPDYRRLDNMSDLSNTILDHQ
jgi:hypothetical protein